MELSDDVKALNPGVDLSEKINKYHNRRTEYNGEQYDSQAEARKAQELDLMIKAGQIDFYLRQVTFPLPGGIKYRADFVVFTNRGNKALYFSAWIIEVIEVKGHPTKEWKLKEKLFRATYPNLNLVVEA